MESATRQETGGVAAVSSRETICLTSGSADFTGQPTPVGEPIRAAGDQLVRTVHSLSDTLNRDAARSDAEGRLGDEALDLLTGHGFWKMRLCRELGGLELPIVAQIDVLSALAAEDTSSAWCTMVANNGVSTLGATMPMATVRRVFADGVPRCSIVAPPAGSATPTEGGFTLNGTWRLASGIHHADWVYALTFIERDPSRPLPLAIPAGDLELLDTWNVVGLAATGSKDFKLTNYFLPAELTGSEHAPFTQLRGTRRYDSVDVEFLESYEHLAFAVGVTRRALRELQLVFSAPLPGRYVFDREVVEGEIGRALVELHAVEASARSVFSRIDAAASGDVHAWSGSERHLPRALASWATNLALKCVQLAFHRAGLIALRKPNIFEKLLRDMSVAATHVVVDDQAFVAYAQHWIETGAPLESRPLNLNSVSRD